MNVPGLPESRRVIFDVCTPMNYVVMAPVYRALRSDPRIAFFRTSSHEHSRRFNIYREQDGAWVRVRRSEARRIEFDIAVSADAQLGPWPDRSTCSIQMFHGVGGKYADVYDTPTESMRGWDRLFFINKIRMAGFLASGAIDAESTAPRLIGMPKVDCLVDGTYDRDRVLESLGLDPARRSVLYAPTWTKYSSLGTMGVPLVRELIAAGYAVIVKLHDRANGSRLWRPRARRRLASLLTPGQGHLARSPDSSPFLVAADALVTDHSSIGFEYLLLDRPVVRIEMPALLAETRTRETYARLLRRAAVTVGDASDAMAAVEQELSNPNARSDERMRVAATVFHDAGSATKRALQEIYDVLELPPLVDGSADPTPRRESAAR